jgi:hypothetical protein
MKTVLLLAASALTVSALVILNMRSMKKYHPSAELLIAMLQRLFEDSAKKN